VTPIKVRKDKQGRKTSGVKSEKEPHAAQGFSQGPTLEPRVPTEDNIAHAAEVAASVESKETLVEVGQSTENICYKKLKTSKERSRHAKSKKKRQQAARNERDAVSEKQSSAFELCNAVKLEQEEGHQAKRVLSSCDMHVQLILASCEDQMIETVAADQLLLVLQLQSIQIQQRIDTLLDVCAIPFERNAVMVIEYFFSGQAEFDRISACYDDYFELEQSKLMVLRLLDAVTLEGAERNQAKGELPVIPSDVLSDTYIYVSELDACKYQLIETFAADQELSAQERLSSQTKCRDEAIQDVHARHFESEFALAIEFFCSGKAEIDRMSACHDGYFSQEPLKQQQLTVTYVGNVVPAPIRMLYSAAVKRNLPQAAPQRIPVRPLYPRATKSRSRTPRSKESKTRA
jgi:hypothetical protein